MEQHTSRIARVSVTLTTFHGRLVRRPVAWSQTGQAIRSKCGHRRAVFRCSGPAAPQSGACAPVGLCVSPEYRGARRKQAEKAGVEHLNRMTDQAYDFATGELAAFRDKIFPALGRAKQPA